MSEYNWRKEREKFRPEITKNNCLETETIQVENCEKNTSSVKIFGIIAAVVIVAVIVVAGIFIFKSGDASSKLVGVAEKYKTAVGLVTVTLELKNGSKITEPVGTAWAFDENRFATNGHVANGLNGKVKDVIDATVAELLTVEAKKAGCEEIIRRYYSISCDMKKGTCSQEVLNRITELMTRLNLDKQDREIVKPALEKAEKEKTNVVAIQLQDGRKITGKESKLLSASSAMLLNALKELSNIPDEEYLLSPYVLEGILKMKQKISYRRNYCLNIQEVLIALSICSTNNRSAEKAMEQLENLNELEAHSSYILTTEENNVMKNLGIRLTCEPKFDN